MIKNLNDIMNLHAGTKEQEEALDKWHNSLQKENRIVLFSFELDCEYLKSIGLYEVNYKGKTYKYGTEWLDW